MTTTSVTANPFLNSSTAVGVFLIAVQYTFFHFSNLRFDKVAFVRADFPLGQTVSPQNYITHLTSLLLHPPVFFSLDLHLTSVVFSFSDSFLFFLGLSFCHLQLSTD